MKFYPEIYGNFPVERNITAHGMKSDENLFFCQIYVIFEENGTCCDWLVFFCISERFEDFSKPEAITDSPFNC